MNILKMILKNRWLKITLFVTALQQIGVATGTSLRIIINPHIGEIKVQKLHDMM